MFNELIERILAIVHLPISADMPEAEILALKLDQITLICEEFRVDESPRQLCLECVLSLPEEQLADAYEALIDLVDE